MNKNILHLDLDTFFVSCERLIDSRLQKRPLLVGGTGDRGVVAACSYETRRFGVYSGMPMKLAKRLCPEAVVFGVIHLFTPNIRIKLLRLSKKKRPFLKRQASMSFMPI